MFSDVTTFFDDIQVDVYIYVFNLSISKIVKMSPLFVCLQCTVLDKFFYTSNQGNGATFLSQSKVQEFLHV